MRKLPLLFTCLVGSFALVQGNTLRADVDGPGQLAATFSVPATTEVPGKNLKAGDYKIKVLDHLADRMVVRIEDSKGKSEGVFLALPNRSLASPNGAGPIPWSGGPNRALRGFAFPEGAVEFVYPKEEAVGIAKANNEKVLAIDPKSEGRPAASQLSDEDRQMVTLWMLSSTRVGPTGDGQPAIAAERYVAPATVLAAERPQPATPRQTARVDAPNPVATPPAPKPAPKVQVAALNRPAGIKALPHTGSNLPVMLLAAILGLCAAAGIRLVRVRQW